MVLSEGACNLGNNRPYTRIQDEDSESIEEVEGAHSDFENWGKSTVGILVLFLGFMLLSSQLVQVETDIDHDEVHMYHTSQNGRIFEEFTFKFKSLRYYELFQSNNAHPSSEPSMLYIDSNQRFQDIIGFGGAFTEAAAVNYFKLPLHWRMHVLEAYFGLEGAQFKIGRISINSCDFSTSTYSFDDVPGDFSLSKFDHHVQRDTQNIIPFIQQAKRMAQTDISLLASPWSPPAWMKVPQPVYQDQSTNFSDVSITDRITYSAPAPAQSMLGSAVPNGLIDSPEVKLAWARYISKFISAYKQHGLHVWAITPQNEPEFAAPWEACTYNSSFQKHFVEEYLGPVLRQDHVLNDGGHIKILAYDHNKEHLEAWTTEMFGDVNAQGGASRGNNPKHGSGSSSVPKSKHLSYVDGMAFHWYSSVDTGQIRMLDGAFGYDAVNNAHHIMHQHVSPETQDTEQGLHMAEGPILLPTEGCSCSGVRLGDWVRAERLGHDVLYDLANHAQGYVMWNLLVDAKGGPNHLQNYCDAPIVVVPDHSSFSARIQPSFYYMKHFSHFLLAGSRRIQAAIVGNYHYELNMDPMMSAGVEVGLFPCEHSVRQFWTLNSDSGVLEMKVPSLLDPTVVPPTDGSTPCQYNSSWHDFDYTSSTCQKQRLCVFGPLTGINPSDSHARSFLKLGDCLYPPPDAPLFRFDAEFSRLRDERSGKCVESVINRQDSGFLLRLNSCGDSDDIHINSQQVFQYDQTTGEIQQQVAPSTKSAMCLTAGWPFLSSVAFLDTRAVQQTVAIVINEANYQLKLRLFNNNSSSDSVAENNMIDGDASVRQSSLRKKRHHHSAAATKETMARYVDIMVDPRSISTVVYLN